MLTIGFTTQFYTLWDVVKFQKWTTVNGVSVPYWCTQFTYMRNLSMDLDKATAKLQEFVGPEGEFNTDLTLKGNGSFIVDEDFTPKEKAEVNNYTFTFGRLKGTDIRTACTWEMESAEKRIQAIVDQIQRDGEDRQLPWESKEAIIKFHTKDSVWQLERAMKLESTMRRRVYARRRLIELGQLVRRSWVEKIPTVDPFNGETIAYREIKRKWMAKNLAKWYEEIGDKKGHFYNDGERIELTLTALKTKKVDSTYGIIYIITFKDHNSNIITYKGGKCLKDGTYKGTIHHDTYNGVKQTYIKRPTAIKTTTHA